MQSVEVKLNKKFLIFSFLALILVLALFFSFYFYRKYKLLSTNLSNPQQVKQAVAETVKLVGKHFLLPEGEEPLLITVTDIEKVKGQPFFAKAENGDRVLVYQNAKKAILYSPGKDRILEVGPVVPGSPTPTPKDATASASEAIISIAPIVVGSDAPTIITASPKFLLYNGTSISGLTRIY